MNPSPTSRLSLWFLTAAVVVISLQVAIFAGFIATTLPDHYSAETAGLFLRGRTAYPREYDLEIYRIFIMAHLLGVPLAWRLLRHRLGDQGFIQTLKCFVGVSLCWLGLGFFAAFKMVIYHSPLWAKNLLFLSILGQIWTWLLWPIVFQKGREWAHCSLAWLDKVCWGWPDAVIILGIFYVIGDDPGRVASALTTDKTSVTPQWFTLSMALSGVYVTVFYVLMRRFLRRLGLALAALVLMVKWLVFHGPISPMIWVVNKMTVWPHCWDIMVFYGLYEYALRRKTWVLAVSLLGVSVALSWQFMQGLVLLGAAALILVIVTMRERRWTHLKMAAVIIAGGYVMLFKLVHSPWTDSPTADIPFFYSLRYGAMGAFSMSFIMPCFYMVGLLQAWHQMRSTRGFLSVWILGVCAYGLLSYANFVRSPVLTGYLSVSWPLVVVWAWWIKSWLETLADGQRRAVLGFLVSVALIALGTNQLWFLDMGFRGGP